MSSLRPTDPEVLARAVADSLVVLADSDSARSCVFYFYRARPYLEAVAEGVRDSGDEQIRSLGELLQKSPADPELYRSFKKAVAARGTGEPAMERIFEAAWHAEGHNRLGYHLGERYSDDGAPSVTAEALVGRTPVNRPSAGADAEILVVIPFQDRKPARARLRNLLACLLTLNDQSYPRERYRVVVVESDDHPRHRAVIEPLVDTYLFAPNAGIFGKSWAVNVGVVHAAGAAEAICILDADVLADRDFIARNADRFRQIGTAGHLTYRNMHCLSDVATSNAIRQRLDGGAGQADLATLRGFVMRRPPGCCVWARTSAFHRIGGMDERYVGWGGEDNDFAYRMDVNLAFDSYDDVLLHMGHPPSSVLVENGRLPNDDIPPLTWQPGQSIGQIDKFAGTVTGAAPA